jgi:hypothetical protein
MGGGRVYDGIAVEHAETEDGSDRGRVRIQNIQSSSMRSIASTRTYSANANEETSLGLITSTSRGVTYTVDVEVGGKTVSVVVRLFASW